MKPICMLLAIGFCAGALLAADRQVDAAKGHKKIPSNAVSHKKHPRHPKGTDNWELTRNSYIYRSIQRPKVSNSKAMTDNWQTGSKPVHPRHKKK